MTLRSKHNHLWVSPTVTRCLWLIQDSSLKLILLLTHAGIEQRKILHLITDDRIFSFKLFNPNIIWDLTARDKRTGWFVLQLSFTICTRSELNWKTTFNSSRFELKRNSRKLLDSVKVGQSQTWDSLNKVFTLTLNLIFISNLSLTSSKRNGI